MNSMELIKIKIKKSYLQITRTHSLLKSYQNANSVIIYSPLCCSKPIRLSFIFGSQKIYFYESWEVSAPPLKLCSPKSFKLQNFLKNNVEVIHVTSVV